MAQDLSKKERRYIWIYSSLFLVFLLFLFFVGLFLDVKDDHPFLNFFLHIANICAAISAGMLASTLSGFFELVVRREFGARGKIYLKAASGFAVFLVVIWMNPKNQMFGLADTVFSQLVAECESAVSDSRANPNAKRLCTEVAERFPTRPEPKRYLARWHHIRGDAAKSHELYAEAVELYGIDSNFSDDSSKLLAVFAKMSTYDQIHFLETLSGYIVAGFDTSLQPLKSDDGTLANTIDIFDLSFRAAEYATSVLTDHDDPVIHGRVRDVVAKGKLYKYFLLSNDIGILRDTIEIYNQAIELEPAFSFLLHYHRTFTQIILESSYKDSKKYVPAKDHNAMSYFQYMLDDWYEYKTKKDNAVDIPLVKDFMRDMRQNVRVEQYQVSLPFGSREFGGREFQTFLSRHKVLNKKFEHAFM